MPPKKKKVSSKGEAKSPRAKSAKAGSPRPVSGYIMFTIEQRPIMTEEHPDYEFAEITRYLANMWKALSKEEKKVYEEMGKRHKKSSHKGSHKVSSPRRAGACWTVDENGRRKPCRLGGDGGSPKPRKAGAGHGGGGGGGGHGGGGGGGGGGERHEGHEGGGGRGYGGYGGLGGVGLGLALGSGVYGGYGYGGYGTCRVLTPYGWRRDFC
jgi:hypothetical protein